LELIAENMAIRKFFSFKIWRVWAFFFPWKVGCKGRNHILLGQKFGEISLKKNCDNHFGYEQKSLTKHWHAGPFCDQPLAGGEGG
jgi:hypothetical protein